MGIGYAFQNYNSKSMARVKGTYMPISRKDAREIGATIKNMQIEKAIAYLKRVEEKTQAVPVTMYDKKAAHHTNTGPSWFPVRAATATIKLLESLKSNAQQKGMGTKNLVVIHTAVQKGPRRTHNTLRRKSGQERKITHFEIVAEEREEKKSEKRGAKGAGQVTK